MPAVTLSQVARGIDRTRVRGNAQPDGLYELTNAYVSPSRTIRKRPGFRRIGSVPNVVDAFSAGWEAKGLASLNGSLVFFSDRVRSGFPALRVIRYVPLSGEPAGFVDSAILSEVRMIGVFLGRLYVAARWILPTLEERVRHYWMQDPPAWEAVQPYDEGDTVKASPDNGFVYALRTVPEYNAWRPNTEYSLGESVQPTEANGYRYELIAHEDTPIASGDSEPAWPTTFKPPRHRVTERRSPTATIVQPPPADPPQPPNPSPGGPGPGVRADYDLRWREGGRYWQRPEWIIE
jgi:hypothetical protein